MCLVNVLINSCKMAIYQEKAQCLSRFIETKLDVRLSENAELSTKEVHHHVLQFIDETKIL